MKRLLSVIVALLCLGPAIAQDAKPTTDELASFRAAYTSGTGLAYVVVKDDQARPCTATAMRRVRQRNETSAASCCSPAHCLVLSLCKTRVPCSRLKRRGS